MIRSDVLIPALIPSALSALNVRRPGLGKSGRPRGRSPGSAGPPAGTGDAPRCRFSQDRGRGLDEGVAFEPEPDGIVDGEMVQD